MEAPGIYTSLSLSLYISLSYSQDAGCMSLDVSFDRCVSNLRLRALHLMIGQFVQYLGDLPIRKIHWPLLVRGMVNLKTWERSPAGW